jgi:DNA polymerase III gamma/tau subunit
MLLADPEIKIDSIRDLISAPGHPSWIIPRAHLMNKQASNALLKTLEEPRNDQFFILMAPNARSLLPTLVSRCQRIIFKSAFTTLEDSGVPSIPEKLSECLELIERLSKDKSDLNQILVAWQKDASTDFKQALLKAQEDLKKHVNTQLILESLLLSKKT